MAIMEMQETIWELGQGEKGQGKKKGSIGSRESGGRDDRREVAGIVSESMGKQWKDGKAMGRITK